MFAPVAQGIERFASDEEVGGSSPSGRNNCRVHKLLYNLRESGYGLVVERYLAKVQIRVRFPVPAQKSASTGCVKLGISEWICG